MKAFPFSDEDAGAYQEGMDLRDYFAGLAMQGIMVHYGMAVPDFDHPDEPNCDHEIARWAYELADAMMVARNINKNK